MTNNKLERVLSVEGAEEFKTLLSRRTNVKIPKYFDMIIDTLIEDLDRTTTQKDLTDPQWPLIRAYRDGGKFYLQQLSKLFKET